MADSGDDAGGKSLVGNREADRASFLSGAWDKDEKSESDTSTDDAGDDETELDVDLDDEDIDGEGDDADEESEESTDDDDEKDADADKAKDAETAKRMDAVRRREERSRELIATERKAFERERDEFVAEWKPKIAAAEKFEAMKARGVTAYTVVDMLAELGLPESEYLDASRAIYAMSADGKKDPKNAEALARVRKERERDEKLSKLEKEIEERKSAETKAREEEQAKQAATKYLDGVAKAAPTGTLAAHFLKSQPDKTRAQLGKITMQLAEKSGAVPSPKQVLAAYEKARAKQLRSLGVDPATITKAAPAKEAAAKNGEKKTAKQTTADDDDKPLTKEEFVKLRSIR